MSKVEIKKENVDAAYKVADENVKKVLNALFGKERKKPTLDDHTTIQSYEDACEALGEPQEVFMEGIPPHIVALMKLETISRALWGRTFQPKPDAEGKEIYWWVWWALYTQSEIDNMDEDDRGALLSAYAATGASAGFGFLGTGNRSSHSAANFGFRLCQETAEKARYFGRTFNRLWAEYLAFNFTVEI
ncbi:hypothetical protein M2451_002511 [Dysgonomonas sp. PFB1-18]|uniref:hypothetical protein n=1 Tax=unclassified Dysgonomonas TaxID=2630389 RepID=UPI0024735EA5|nr:MULTISPECIES: hypothetical protein [unclassified Dysgonomonas]MDH6307992.1 hypothetical protein [Dysgonomonas sp. PF1-14]MDH6339531.1 hypothetical protein [Dysgonomonas sp. PF1-16]MDH6381182.1 hypothetical protein [Dysgonomonas sp. PFB1-18]MDH6398394.1 hypothetical protein [Dysgonomonas sp. PF1-23]